ncbi:glycosyltransferase family 2 protein [Flavobacterium sp. A45]|uniref:glycosyltransferase family 2 protein n=1 Tax=Flavobacterium sp. A45 TaxID=1945862 RepID=UPI000984D9B4|nr:glycosyltransferase family 2 protein [Flavobacterium sp. A45]OOG71467.1 glycosyl transferase family 2 [Flavobacterium sp. A45]
MKFSLIICTFMRPKPLLQLLQSVKEQTLYPNEILIIDGSTDNETELTLKENNFDNLHYYLVPNEHRGLTKQRNFGIACVESNIEVVCFLDDDTVLEKEYFKELIDTFRSSNAITGVGGVAINENNWEPILSNKNYNKDKYFSFDGFVYKEGQRNEIRNYLGLQSNLAPGKMPDFSHGRTCGFPLNDEMYEVDLLIGMSMAFRKKVVDHIQFSSYFEGYGLYEDVDFSVRSLQFGKNVINTRIQLSHFHNPLGRPNQYQYGKMVVRNGWYVWRVKNPKPKVIDFFKWHAITILLTIIRFSNIITTNNRKEAFTEAFGRTMGWWSLIFSRPKE